MKKILLTVGLLVGAIGAANADVRGEFVAYPIKDGEIPRKVVDNFNAAQRGINERRNKILNALVVEQKKGKAAKKETVYQLLCVELPPLLNALMRNDQSLLKYMKSEKTAQLLKSNMEKNTQTLNVMNQQCDMMRNEM